MTTYDFIAENKRRTVVLLTVFSVFVLSIGFVIDQYKHTGGAFLGFAIIYTVISALVSYYAGDTIALRMSDAQQITAAENKNLYRTIENLCISQGLPMPKVYVINDPAINAFATGRDPQHASIAVTTGALTKLENEELEGVLAHELSHVQNYDIRVMTIVIVLVGIVSIMANLIFRMSFGERNSKNDRGAGPLLVIAIVLMICAPIIANLIQLAISRRREYLADASGALMTRFPEGLARALRKIERDALPMANPSAATAHLFIANPFTNMTLAKFFSTHPPIADRIAKLEQMASLKEMR